MLKNSIQWRGGSDPPVIWISWYFNRGIATLITGPLFLLFVAGFAISVFDAVIQGIGLGRANRAAFGFVGEFVGFPIGWIPIIIPPTLYYYLAKSLPCLWLHSDASRRIKILMSIIIIVLIPLGAELVSSGVVWSIGWVADHNPCAALSVGVTGSNPPINCP
jgi:hypothetical protein